MNLRPFLGAVALVATCTFPALAETFNFSFSGSSVFPYSPATTHAPERGLQDQGSGTFTTTLTSTPGQYEITGVSGETNGVKIAGLLGLYGFAGNDNTLLYGDGAAVPLTGSGVSYALANGQLVNLYFSAFFDGGGLSYTPEIVMETPPEGPGAVFLQSLTIAPAMAQAPEPGTMSLVGLGLMGAVGAVRRRFC